MNEDIVAAVASFIQDAMGQLIASATGYAQAYSDYAPGINPDGSKVVQPYAVVTEGPEMYAAQSEDPAGGYYLSNLATGTLTVTFYSTTKANARFLGRVAVRKLSDSQVQLVAADGRVVTVLPIRADSAFPQSTGVDEPSLFVRIVTFQYVQQFPE